MKPNEYFDKAIRWTARMLSEQDGTPSAGRVALIAAIYTAIVAALVLLVRHPDMSVDLVKFLVPNAVAVYGLNKGAAVLSGKQP